MPAAIWTVKPALPALPAHLWVGAGAEAARDGVWVGSLAESMKGKIPQVWLSTQKEQVIAVVGKRGSGKSFTLGAIVEGLSVDTTKAGADRLSAQSQRSAVLVFDPLDVYWPTRFPVFASDHPEAQRHFMLAKAQRLTGLEFQVSAWVPGDTNTRVTDPDWFQTLILPVPELGLDEWDLLLGADTAKDPMAQALVDAVHLVRSSGYQRRGKSFPAAAAYNMKSLAEAVESDELAGVYHGESLRALRQRLLSLHMTGLFGESGTDITDLCQAGRAAVILLGRVPEGYRGVVVSVLTRMLIDRRTDAAFALKRRHLEPDLEAGTRKLLDSTIEAGPPRCVVVLDEAQNFLASDANPAARRVFVRLVKEGRNIGLSAILATQQPSAVDKRILSQVETFIAHQLVTSADISAVRDNLKSSLPQTIQFGRTELQFSDLMRRLAPGQCIVSAASMNSAERRVIIAQVRARATTHGGIEL